jgi:predicted GNAT family acetyltransferase
VFHPETTMSAIEPDRTSGLDRPPTVANNEQAHRFELRAPDGSIAELVYHMRGPTTIVLLHTEVPPELRGHGIAGKLARAALEHARAHGLRVRVKCPYVRAFLEQHPEYRDLVDADGDRE